MGRAENQQYYKSRGLCVRCGKKHAEEFNVLCYECGLVNRQRSNEYRNSMNPEQYAEYLKKISITQKSTYQRRKQSGLCTRCGKRQPAWGCLKCRDCLDKQNQFYKTKIEGIHRSEYSEHGLCLYCGEPVLNGLKLCDKHYTNAVEHAKRMSKKTNHPWRMGMGVHI